MKGLGASHTPYVDLFNAELNEYNEYKQLLKLLFFQQ